MIELLNMLEFDVWVPGNHDFEEGYSSFYQCFRKFRGTVLGVQWHWRNIRPAAWKMFEVNGVRAAVIGATDPAMSVRSLPGTDGTFRDTVESIGAVLPEIKAAKPHVIILVYHNGEYSRLGNVYQLSSTYPEINLILGGHSHQEVWGKTIGDAFFVQAGSKGSCVARVRIKTDDKSGKLLRIESGVFYPDPAKTDKVIAGFCRKLEQEAQSAGAVTAAAVKKLYRLPERKDKFSRLGELGARALLSAAKADAAFFSLPLVKKNVYQSKDALGRFVITEKILFEMFTFTNRICVVELEREDLAELEVLIRHYSGTRKRRYYFAGVLSVDRKGKIASKSEKFKVAVSDYLLTSFPVMQRKLQNREKWYLIPGLFERDIIRKALQNR